jgi:hypothetical protein
MPHAEMVILAVLKNALFDRGSPLRDRNARCNSSPHSVGVAGFRTSKWRVLWAFQPLFRLLLYFAGRRIMLQHRQSLLHWRYCGDIVGHRLGALVRHGGSPNATQLVAASVLRKFEHGHRNRFRTKSERHHAGGALRAESFGSRVVRHVLRGFV